ncbi:GPX1 (predicted) [Pycnogonum litorale]
MNQLMSKFGEHRLAVLCFPCNQFGHQENAHDREILNSLRFVRPGDGFVPKCDIFSKVDVNGSNTCPLFKFLKDKLPFPFDDKLSFFNNPQFIIWSPVTRSDVSWNFEKFLVSADGIPYRRYSRNFETIELDRDIETLLRRK